ncbi:MAG: sigma-70 family RNA polymerase sigma factor, partial [Candidatus Poribacteria bacterium]|nr:sigma-70 family RNA polymerase sigma factor [Candidatus Poribacteria bacterium]
MSLDIAAYRGEIGKFVNALCDRYYRHSQPDDRLDLRNEVALVAHTNRERLAALGEKERLGWLHETARNVVRNASRRERRSGDEVVEDEAFELASEAALPDAALIQTETKNAVRDAIQRLPDIHQQVVWLFYVDQVG